MLKRIFASAALCSALAAGQAAAQEAPPAAPEFSGAQIMQMFFTPKHRWQPPVCIVDGRPVEYRYTDLVTMLHGHGKMMALANRDGYNNPFILADVQTMSSVDPVFRNFVFKHECKHHQQDHTKDYREHLHQAREDEADCLAIQEYKAEGLDRAGLELIKAYNRAMIQAFYPRYHKDGLTEVRNTKLTACYDGLTVN